MPSSDDTPDKFEVLLQDRDDGGIRPLRVSRGIAVNEALVFERNNLSVFVFVALEAQDDQKKTSTMSASLGSQTARPRLKL